MNEQPSVREYCINFATDVYVRTWVGEEMKSVALADLDAEKREYWIDIFEQLYTGIEGDYPHRILSPEGKRAETEARWKKPVDSAHLGQRRKHA